MSRNYKPYNKYHARKSGGFASQKERRRFQELQLLERAGEIADLRCQVKFVLIPTQREPWREKYTRGPRKGQFKPGRVIEQECYYLADFVYTDANTGEMVVEDAKGYKQGEAYKLFAVKRKLMLKEHGIRIREV